VSLTPRQRVLLGALAVVLGLVVWQRLGPALRGDSGPGGTAAGSGAVVDAHVEELRVADLEPRPSVHETGRDPFRFGSPPAPPGPTPEEIEAARQRALAEAEARARALAAQPATPALPPEPQPPAVTLRYLGSFGSTRRRVAVFSDGNSIYNALEGDVLEGKFIVHRIGLESVDLRFVGFPKAPAQRLAAGS
jgi:hypothetical protein